MAEQFANNAQSIIVVALAPTDLICTVQNALSFPPIGDFRVSVDNELMLVTAVAGNVFTVVRGIEGTIPDSHSNYSIIIEPLTAGALRAISAATDIVVDLSSSVVVDTNGNVVSGG